MEATLSSQDLHLFLFPLRLLFPALKVPPAVNPLLPGVFPILLMIAFSLPLLQRRIFLRLLPSLFLHLRFHLPPPPGLGIHNHLDSLLPPLDFERFRLELLRIVSILVLSDQKFSGICDTLIEMLSFLLVKQRCLRFLQPVESLGCLWILSLVRMDQ
jgi:hypothetical protein